MSAMVGMYEMPCHQLLNIANKVFYLRLNLYITVNDGRKTVSCPVSFRLTWASYQIRKIACWACVGNAGNVFPRRQFQRKLLVSDPGMHHGTCVTHVPWCMSGSLTCGDGEIVPGIPGACAPAILRIWQVAHGRCPLYAWYSTWYGSCGTKVV